MLPVAVDALGGDKAPAEIVAGAKQAAAEGIPVLLVGPADLQDIGELPLHVATEFIDMHEDPASSVRNKKDSTLVVSAELVRDGKASAMISAGNTGATMASALLRMGRIKGVKRPAIATPIPVPGSTPTVMLDAGANAEVEAAWMTQFALMGTVYARARFGIEKPRVGLLSIGEESTKGNPLVKETHKLLAEGTWIGETGAQFIGNVEGRDIMTDDVDVVVTDGFTGNVALKTLEGSLKSIINSLLAAFDSSDEARAAAAALWPSLMPLYDSLDPENTGGAMLLGVDGVCIISHGSSSDRAMVNAVRVAADMVNADVVGHIAATVRLAD